MFDPNEITKSIFLDLILFKIKYINMSSCKIFPYFFILFFHERKVLKQLL